MHHNINMFTTGNTHLKYRKHRVHSAAHKLKIRSSRLVLTTGTDLDSTDRAAIGGAKNSSASKPLNRPILSLWNSCVLSSTIVLYSCTYTEVSLSSVRGGLEDDDVGLFQPLCCILLVLTFTCYCFLSVVVWKMMMMWGSISSDVGLTY